MNRTNERVFIPSSLLANRDLCQASGANIKTLRNRGETDALSAAVSRYASDVDLHFSPTYSERVILRNGLAVDLRLIRPDDKQHLLRGFHELSSTSRYLRFLVPKTSLSDRELRYLTEVDYRVHVAIAAATVPTDDNEEPRGLGIARLIALDHEPGQAEAAIAVRDDIQGQGLGSILFQRLVAAGRERGITHVRCEVLAYNAAMKDLISAIAPKYTLDIGGGVMTIVFPLDEHSAPADIVATAADSADGASDSTKPTSDVHWSPLQAFFSSLARGTMRLRELFTAPRS